MARGVWVECAAPGCRNTTLKDTAAVAWKRGVCPVCVMDEPERREFMAMVKRNTGKNPLPPLEPEIEPDVEDEADTEIVI